MLIAALPLSRYWLSESTGSLETARTPSDDELLSTLLLSSKLPR